jgi:hypothetical protein
MLNKNNKVFIWVFAIMLSANLGSYAQILPTMVPKSKPVVKKKVANNVKGSSKAAAENLTPEETVVEETDSVTVNLDMKSFSVKALQKTNQFATYIQAISSGNSSRETAAKSIDLACSLFLNEDARVEVSSLSSTVKNKYKIRDYLNRLQLKGGQYDKISIEYADVNYASKFKKGTDGNYYGVVTFVQKFKGFLDGKMIYGDVTKRNMTVVLHQYEKAVEGGTEANWDVFLADIGVVETKHL